MIGYGDSEGGTLSNPEINDLVTLIQQGSWRSVQTVPGEPKPDPDGGAAGRTAVRRCCAVRAVRDGQRGMGDFQGNLHLVPHAQRNRRDQSRHRQKPG